MLISRTATHCRSTAAVRIATAAAESANHGTVWGVTAADRRDVLKTLAGTRPHTRGCSTENNANRRGGSRRSAAVSCVSSPQGRDSSPCRSQLPRGVHRPRSALVRTLAPAPHRNFPAHCCWRRLRGRPPVWAQFVFYDRELPAIHPKRCIQVDAMGSPLKGDLLRSGLEGGAFFRRDVLNSAPARQRARRRLLLQASHNHSIERNLQQRLYGAKLVVAVETNVVQRVPQKDVQHFPGDAPRASIAGKGGLDTRRLSIDRPCERVRAICRKCREILPLQFSAATGDQPWSPLPPYGGCAHARKGYVFLHVSNGNSHGLFVLGGIEFK